MSFLSGKRFLIVGIASQKSIAWGIAEAMYKQGASLAFTYQSERLKSRVVQAAEEFGSSESLCFPATWQVMQKSPPCSSILHNSGMGWMA